MKKILLLICLFIIPFNVYGIEDAESEKIEISLIKCEKYNTYMIKENNVTKRVKLIAFDGNETDSNYIDKYVCDMIENSSLIEIEYDIAEKDKYNRYPVWLYLDGKRLQDTLVKEGLGQVNYIEGDYNYLDDLCDIQKDAINNNIGIWKKGVEEKYCQSGIELEREEQEKIEKEQQKEEHNNDYMWYLLVLNTIILILLVLLRGNYHEKR